MSTLTQPADVYQPPHLTTDTEGEPLNPRMALEVSEPLAVPPTAGQPSAGLPAENAHLDYHHAEPAGYAGVDSYGSGGAHAYHPQPPHVADALPPDQEVQSMVATIQSFSSIPIVCAAGGLCTALAMSSALSGGAWKTGVLGGKLVTISLTHIVTHADKSAAADDPASVSPSVHKLSFRCSDFGELEACRLASAGLAVRVLLCFAMLAIFAATVSTCLLILLDGNRLHGLRAQLGYSGVAGLPKVAMAAWAATVGLLASGALLYTAISPFRWGQTTLALDASFGLVRLALLLALLCGTAHTMYVKRVRALVVSGTHASAAEPGGLGERPVEVELGLELVRATRVLADKSRALAALLAAQLALQLVCIIHAPQWSAVLVFAGAAACAYSQHHLATFYIHATAISALYDVLDLMAGPPLTMASGGYTTTYMLLLLVTSLKVAGAALVAHLDERSGAGYGEYLMRQQG